MVVNGSKIRFLYNMKVWLLWKKGSEVNETILLDLRFLSTFWLYFDLSDAHEFVRHSWQNFAT